MEQTTQRKQEPVEAVAFSSDLHTLTVLLQEKQAECAALRRRVEFLEHRLLQRQVLTENKFSEKMQFFDRVCHMALKIFLDNPERSFTYDQFTKEFEVYYPHVPTGHLGRRLRDLRDQSKLWSDVDPDTREVRFYLKLEETTQA